MLWNFSQDQITQILTYLNMVFATKDALIWTSTGKLLSFYIFAFNYKPNRPAMIFIIPFFCKHTFFVERRKAMTFNHHTSSKPSYVVGVQIFTEFPANRTRECVPILASYQASTIYSNIWPMGIIQSLVRMTTSHSYSG